MQKIDTMQLNKYIGCFIYQTHGLPVDEMLGYVRSHVDHLFNWHTWYSSEWCYTKELSEKDYNLVQARIKLDDNSISDSDLNLDYIFTTLSHTNNYDSDGSYYESPTAPSYNGTNIEKDEIGLDEEEERNSNSFSSTKMIIIVMKVF